MLKNYSKPVLTNDVNSGYKKEFDFSISIDESKIIDGYVKLRIKCILNTKVIKDYIENKDAVIGIRVRTHLRSLFIKFESIQDDYIIDVEQSDLEKIDTIKCIAYVASTKELEYIWNEELKDFYDKDLVFHYNKNEVLAESNEDKIEYSSSAEPFISLKASEERENKGLLFDIKSPNMINVKVGKKYNEAYNKLQGEDKKVCVKDILNSFLAFNSILYALTSLSMKDDISNEKDKDWYKALDYCFDEESYESLEDFITMMHNDMNLDEIYRVSQNIINNQLEYKVIDTWRRL